MQVDPLKQVQADAAELEAGLTSRRKLIAARGWSIEDLDAERTAEAEASRGTRRCPPDLNSRCLDHTTDVRCRSTHGRFVMTTFVPVTRKDGKGPYIERLDPAGLDTSGLIGAPCLNSHRTGDASDVIGVITAFRWEADKLIGTARLSGAADAQPTVQRIAEGTVRGVSIGYRARNGSKARTPWASEPARRLRGRLAKSLPSQSLPMRGQPSDRKGQLCLKTIKTKIAARSTRACKPPTTCPTNGQRGWPRSR